MASTKLGLLVCMIYFVVIIPRLRAETSETAETVPLAGIWLERQAQAKKEAQVAYDPFPLQATSNFNKEIAKSDEESKRTRRSLMSISIVSANLTEGEEEELPIERGKYTGPCKATNPIDRCWRCREDWADDRKRLASCVLGFGRDAAGGKDGEFYEVTDDSDDDVQEPKPGTLRFGVIQNRPLWITFARNMNIQLKQELIFTSHKTVDGRGANVHIANGAGITIQFVKNVILHNLYIHETVSSSGGIIRDSEDHKGRRTRADGDGISIFGSTNVWLDHLTMYNCEDGLIDAIQGSTAITISNSYFTKHDHVILLGASDTNDDDKIMQVTVAFNHFGRGLIQRMPRCRWGFFHVVNNDYTQWEMYAIGGSSHPTIISQGNRFYAPDNRAAKEVTKRDYAPESEWENWTWRSEGDLMLNGAFFRQSGSLSGNRPTSKKDMLNAKPGKEVDRLTRFAGALDCRVGQPC